jgi:hypothetical protein
MAAFELSSTSFSGSASLRTKPDCAKREEADRATPEVRRVRRVITGKLISTLVDPGVSVPESYSIPDVWQTRVLSSPIPNAMLFEVSAAALFTILSPSII